jgi:hypothetical protein
MFNLFKKFMSKQEIVGKPASKMNLVELRELATSLKLASAEEVSKLKKPELLKIVSDWEEKALASKEESKPLKTIGSATIPANLGTFNGKKVVSRTPLELNGKKYIDILVETGETFRELA